MMPGISIGGGLAWTALWFGCMIAYTLLNSLIWKRFLIGPWLHLASVALFTAGYLALLGKKTGFSLRLLDRFGWKQGLLALACAGLFYLLLDKGLDPVLDRWFPASQQDYRQNT